MSFFDLNQIPLKSFPTEVLVALRENIRKELGRRAHAGEDVERKQSFGLYGRARSSNTKFGPEALESKEFKERLWALDALMREDWSHLFPDGDEERRFYVYAHLDPRQRGVKWDGEFKLNMLGLPFYVGKGAGQRAWNLTRNEGHGVQLRQLRELGISDSEIVCIVRDNLTEREALEIESKLIYFFGTKFESGRKGILVNLDFPARPTRAAMDFAKYRSPKKPLDVEV